jgi:hypothetical protein
LQEVADNPAERKKHVHLKGLNLQNAFVRGKLVVARHSSNGRRVGNTFVKDRFPLYRMENTSITVATGLGMGSYFAWHPRGA